MPEAPARVAYVLKGYPRLSEMFIASEIYRLEQAGLPLRLYVIKPPDEAQTHPVVDRIQAPTEYLPPTTSLSATTLAALAAREPAAVPARAARAPRAATRSGLARAARPRARPGVRARTGRFAWPRKVYVKELLQAVALADRLADAPRRAPPARPLRPRHDDGHLAGLDDHRPAVLLHRPRQGHLLAGAQPGRAAAAQAARGALRRHLHRGQRAPPEGHRARGRVHRVYHGLNADFARLLARRAPRRRPARNGDAPRCSAVGRLVAKKGFDDARRRVRRARRAAASPFEAVIVGQDDDARRRGCARRDRRARPRAAASGSRAR